MTQFKQTDMTYVCDAIIKTNAYFPLKKLFIHSFYKSHYHLFWYCLINVTMHQEWLDENEVKEVKKLLFFKI